MRFGILSGLGRMLRPGLLGVAAMTVAVPGILLAHVTTGHDWYAARALTVAEAMLAVGFSKYEPVAYRTTHGDIWNISRIVFVEHEPPIAARDRILSTIGNGVLLGGGVGGTVLCLMLLGAAGHLRRVRAVASVEPSASPYRHPASWAGAERVPDRLQPAGAGRVALPAAPVKASGDGAVVPGDARPCGSAASPRAAAVAGAPPALPAANARTGAATNERRAGPRPPEPPARPESGEAGRPRGKPPGSPRERATAKDIGIKPPKQQGPPRPKPDDDEGWF